MIAAQGPGGLAILLSVFRESGGQLPGFAREAITNLIDQCQRAQQRIAALESKILEWHRADPASKRLAIIPGVGPITASAIAASVPDASLFRSGRQFAAWLGLTPKVHSSGGKEWITGISKQGDGYIRRLLVVGATAVLRYARQDNSRKAWACRLLAGKRPKVVAVALAHKTARIAWALLKRNEVYTAPVTA